MSIDILIVTLYMLALFLMAIFSAQKIHNMEDYAVAGRGYPAWVIYATLCATLIGGGFTIGNAEKIHVHGIIFTLAIIGITVREILIAYFVAPHMTRFKSALTIGDVMKEAYGMPAKIIGGCFAGLLCAGMLGIQLRALGYIFEVFFNVDLNVGILIGCSIVMFYVTIGGFKAVVWTDVLQFIILIVALPLAAIMAVHAAGGPLALLHALPPDRVDLFVHLSPLAFASLLAYYLIGETLAPPYLQRLLIGDAKAVSRGALWTGLTAFPLGIVVTLIALSALVLNPSSPPHQVIPFIVQTVLPTGIAGMVIAAMIAVIMSSADSFLNSAAVTLVHDVSKPLSRKGLSSEQEMRHAKVFTFSIGIIAVVFAISFENLVDGILAIYGLWSPIVLIPLVAAIRGFKANYKVFLALAMTGLVCSAGWDYGIGMDTKISGLLVGTCASLVVFVGVYLWRCNRNNA